MASRLLDTTPTGSLVTDPVIGQYYAIYGEDGLDDIVSSVQSDIAQYLLYDPVLQVHQNEEGVHELVVSGEYAGRYALQLQHQPLVPGLGPQVFIYLTFLYAASFIGPTSVDLEFVSMLHSTGEAYALSPGVPEGLAGISFGAGNTVPNVISVGYVGTYAAGYATGLNDPLPNGGGTGFAATLTVTDGQITGYTITNPGTGYTSVPFMYVTGDGTNAFIAPILNSTGGIGALLITGPGSGYTYANVAISTAPSFYAPPIPPQITRAALLLTREAVLMEQNQQYNLLYNPLAGGVTSVTDGSQKISWASIPQKDPSCFTMGYGTPLAKTAERKIFSLKKRRPFQMI